MIACRRPDWRPRLVAYIEEVRARPFSYGSHDCALFAAGAVEAVTGDDLAVAWRGNYGSLKEGLTRLQEVGAADHLAVVSSFLEPVQPAFAQVGDIAVLVAPGIPALGIFEGEMILVLREDGLGRVPREAATQAFRVP